MEPWEELVCLPLNVFSLHVYDEINRAIKIQSDLNAVSFSDAKDGSDGRFVPVAPSEIAHRDA